MRAVMLRQCAVTDAFLLIRFKKNNNNMHTLNKCQSIRYNGFIEIKLNLYRNKTEKKLYLHKNIHVTRLSY